MKFFIHKNISGPFTQLSDFKFKRQTSNNCCAQLMLQILTWNLTRILADQPYYLKLMIWNHPGEMSRKKNWVYDPTFLKSSFTQ